MTRTITMTLALLMGAFGTGTPAGALQDPSDEAPAIIGQVFDHLGGGIEDMSVTLHRVTEDGPDPEPISRTMTTDFGDFALEIPGDLQGRFLVRLRKTGFADIDREIILAADEPPPFVDAQAEGDLRVEGRVWDKRDRSPLADATIMVSDGFATMEARSDERGRFAVRGVSPGKMEAQVVAPGFATVTQILLTHAQMEPIEFWMEPGWAAIVRIVDPMGNPIPDVRVEMVPPDRRRVFDGETDENGEVTFAGLSPDADRIAMRFSHFALPAMGQFEHEVERVDDTKEVRKEFRVALGARVQGVILDANTKGPIYSARVIGGKSLGGAVPKAWTDGDGRYALTSLAAGPVVLTVHHADYAPALQEIELESGRTGKMDFALSAGRRLTGRVLEADGKPIEQAFVMVERWRGNATAGIRTLTDEKGRFVFEHAPQDSMELSVQKEGYEGALITARADSKEELRIELKAGAMGDSGAQPIASGEPAPDFEIHTLDGATLKLSELRGKVVLIEFWATWCGPCRQQMPHLKETFQEFGKRDDFVMIGISLDHDKRAWKAYVKKEGLSWHQALDRPEAGDSMASLYKVMGVPTAWLIDKEGRVVASGVGAVLSSQEIARLFE